MPFVENSFQPAAANVGPPPRSDYLGLPDDLRAPGNPRLSFYALPMSSADCAISAALVGLAARA
jgi:hypothetical protein